MTDDKPRFVIHDSEEASMALADLAWAKVKMRPWKEIADEKAPALREWIRQTGEVVEATTDAGEIIQAKVTKTMRRKVNLDEAEQAGLVTFAEEYRLLIEGYED